jgi:hypothetical protein
MLHRFTWTLAFLATLLSGTEVIDRIAVIVGKRAIKTSDIDRELRVSSFLNRQPVNESPDARRKVTERLIDQELVRQDLLNGQYSQPTEKDAGDFFQQLKRDRFNGSATRLRADLERYGLTEDQLRRYLLWQLTVLRFIDQRFRTTVLVTDEEIADYYQEHRTDLQKAYPQNNGLEALAPKIRENLTGERINQAFEEWLAETRRTVRIEYRQQAFPGGPTR